MAVVARLRVNRNLIGPIGPISLVCPICLTRHSEEPIGLGAPVPVLDGLVRLAGQYILPAAAVGGRGSRTAVQPVDCLSRENGLQTAFAVRLVHILVSPHLEGFYPLFM